MPHTSSSAFINLSAITSDSFCLSTAESEIDHGSQASIDKPTCKTKLKLSSKPDPTIYSFAWSATQSNSEPSTSPTSYSDLEFSVQSMATSGAEFIPLEARPSRATKEISDFRKEPPTLPHPKFVSSLTHRDAFADYIDSELHLLPNPGPNHGATTGDAGTQPHHIEEPIAKCYSNIANIVLANTDKTKIQMNCPEGWVTQYLLGDNRLPVPFKPSLLFGDKENWCPRELHCTGEDNFAKLPDLSSEQATATWCIDLVDSLGRLHGLRNTNSGNTSQATNLQGHGDRTFNCEGATKPLAKGLIPRKPDIVVIDRNIRDNVPSETRLRWPLVQALIEITSVNKGVTDLVRTFMDKASNMFDSQLHRRYVLGLAIYGKGIDMRYIFVLIDRVGVACTTPAVINGVSAASLARILFAFAFADDWVLGADIRVTIDRFTGNPMSVLVGNEEFTIITEIYVSPYVFGRGTRVYIVEDRYGRHHILKDSWILSSHFGSEIEFIKKISDTAQNGGLSERTQVLSPRFVAGDGHVSNTDEGRTLLTSKHTARIRRRIVTGPIGDPITTYRSRVECLQAMVDVIDREYCKIT